MTASLLEPPAHGYDVHGVKPWSVLRSDLRAWQDRKHWWKDQGLDDRAGRPDATIFHGLKTRTHQRISGGGSTFDPVLAEALITWYSPQGGRILDPTAGGPTRGVVAGTLGRNYHGIDLLPAQVDANRAAWQAWPHHTGADVSWECGDALGALQDTPASAYDYALTCPPYWRLERYSDDPRDLSTMTLDRFHAAHTAIIAATMRALRPDTFATWVIGDLRGDDGAMVGLPTATIAAFQDAGAHLINDQILVTPIGSLYWTMGRKWRPTRAQSRTHQYVLTFVKGDRRTAAERINDAQEDA